MNYIHRLQCDVVELNQNILARADRIQEFRQHLNLAKYDDVQADGSRGDWISKADVLRWLQYIEDTGQHYP